MKRLNNLKFFIALFLLGAAWFFLYSGSEKVMGDESKMTDVAPLEKTNKQWREILPPDRFGILFKEKTRIFKRPQQRKASGYLYLCRLLPAALQIKYKI